MKQKPSRLGLVLLAALACGCKPRATQSDAKGLAEDQAQLAERIGMPVEAKGLLRPGPGFALLEGDDHYLHKSRIHDLVNSKQWDELLLLGKDSQGEYVLQEYDIKITFANGHDVIDVTWTVPALAAFAAPQAVRNLLVQMASGFYAYEKTVPAVPSEHGEGVATAERQLRYHATAAPLTLSSKRFKGEVKILSIDLYETEKGGLALANEPPAGGEEQAATSASAPKEETRQLPVDSLGVEDQGKVRHRPLYYVKNLSGPAQNALDLEYGSLFVMTHEDQSAGSGLGVWLGLEMDRAALAEATRGMFVLGRFITATDRGRFQHWLARLRDGGGVGKIVKTEVLSYRSVRAFDKTGLVVGGFTKDTGLPFVVDAFEYERRANQKPAPDKAQAPLMGDLKAPPRVEGDAKKPAQTLPTQGHWQFEQFGDGATWLFQVYYQRAASGQIGIRGIWIYKNGHHYQTVTSLDASQKDATTLRYTQGGMWWNLAFERSAAAPFHCSLKFDLYGFPLIGWDMHVFKAGNCR